MRRFAASAQHLFRLARPRDVHIGDVASTIVILTSGGVDSSVAAAFSFRCLQSVGDIDALRRLPSPLSPEAIADLIRRRVPFSSACGLTVGHGAAASRSMRHVAVHLSNWREEDQESERGGMCHKALSEYEDALQTVNHINTLPEGAAPTLRPLLNLSLLDFSSEYWEGCMVPLMESYSRGETLNVDVLCNSRVKFGSLLRHCVQKYGSNTHLVTGHYARSMPYDDGNRDSIILARPFSIRLDHNDQTHFLGKLHPTEQLPFGIFPLGHLFHSKQDVRRVADALGLRHVATKKTSTGVCFVSPKTPKFSDWVLQLRNEGLPEKECVPTTAEEPTKLLQHSTNDSHRSDVMCSLGSDHFIKSPAMLGKRFPSAAFTEGEKVMVGRSNMKSLRKMYVSAKVLNSTREYIRELHLCDNWNDGIMLKDRLMLADFAFTCPYVIGKRILEEQKPIWVALRHLDRLIPCCIHEYGAQPLFNVQESVGGSVVVQLREQARCPAVGQLAVLYAALTDHIAPTASDYFVLGSGWIVSAQSSHQLGGEGNRTV